MCLVALFYRVVPDAPLVVGANREEDYARAGESPRLRDDPVRWVGGLDPVGGGTWLGVNEHGLLVAVTNRRKSVLPAQPRSRGLLVRDLLGCASAAQAAELAGQELGTDRYAGCNILCLDAQRAVVLHGGDWLRIRLLPPGLHVLANGDVNDGSDRRVAHTLDWLSQQPHRDAADSLAALNALCGQPSICLRGDNRGTVSSSALALRPTLGDSVYLHAQGPPDVTPYEDRSLLFREMSRSQRRTEGA